MKTKLLAALLALLLLLTACAASAPDGDGAPPESGSDPDPEPVDVSHYYIEDPEREGVEDREAAKDLCLYLRGNLLPKDYSSVHHTLEVKYGDETHENHVYYVDVYGPSKEPIDALLREYDGPYAPIWFHPMERTLFDLWRAEDDWEDFLRGHWEVGSRGLHTNDWEFICHTIVVENITDELTAFVENYPVKDIFWVEEYVPWEMENPD